MSIDGKQSKKGTAESERNDRLLVIIANAYQILGALNAPACILDVMSSPLTATDEQVEEMLPFIPLKYSIDWEKPDVVPQGSD